MVVKAAETCLQCLFLSKCGCLIAKWHDNHYYYFTFLSNSSSTIQGLIIIDLPTKFKINLYLVRVHFVLKQCVLSKVFRKSNRRNFIILKGISFLNSRPWMIKRREFQPSGKHWIIIMIVDTIWQQWWRWLNDKHQSYSQRKSCLSLFSNIMYHGT